MSFGASESLRSESSAMLKEFDFQLRTRVLFGPGRMQLLGEVAHELDFRRTLLVTDAGLVASGHAARAETVLRAAGVEVFLFTDLHVNPSSADVERGRSFAATLAVDSIVGFGGGSSLDCAKGINFVLTNGGVMKDYWGYGKATREMLPTIAVPTTAGTGAEAQSYAVISDAETKRKMACGDPKAAFRAAILDPELLVSQPAGVRAMAGYDAIAHAVETMVTTRRTSASECFSREAWRLLEGNYERSLAEPKNLDVQSAMQAGAYFAGAAIECSMLGAAHACANPLTAKFDIVHGAALAMLLPHVVRWNGSAVGERYEEMLRIAGLEMSGGNPAEALARRLEEFAEMGGLKKKLEAAGVPKTALKILAEDAATQWTGTFNPRPFDLKGALEVYECAY